MLDGIPAASGVMIPLEMKTRTRREDDKYFVAIFVLLHRGQSKGLGTVGKGSKGKCPKLQSNWEGPYLVKER